MTKRPMSIWDHVQLGVLAVFQGPVPVTLAMIASGFLTGIAAGATPGLAGPMVMAVALPILISVFGYEPAALLPRAHGVHDNGIDLGPATAREASPGRWRRATTPPSSARRISPPATPSGPPACRRA